MLLTMKDSSDPTNQANQVPEFLLLVLEYIHPRDCEFYRIFSLMSISIVQVSASTILTTPTSPQIPSHYYLYLPHLT